MTRLVMAQKGFHLGQVRQAPFGTNWWQLDDLVAADVVGRHGSHPVTIPPSDAAFSSSGGIATRTGDSWTTWLPPMSPDDTVRIRVTIPPSDAAATTRAG